MAKLCCWNGNSCKGAVDTAGNFGKTLTESDEFKSAMKNTEKPQNQVDMEVVQNQMRNAIGGSKSELDAQGVQGNGEAPEARSAFIGFMNNPSSLYSLFDAPAGMNYQRNGVLAKYTQVNWHLNLNIRPISTPLISLFDPTTGHFQLLQQ